MGKPVGEPVNQTMLGIEDPADVSDDAALVARLGLDWKKRRIVVVREQAFSRRACCENAYPSGLKTARKSAEPEGVDAVRLLNGHPRDLRRVEAQGHIPE